MTFWSDGDVLCASEPHPGYTRYDYTVLCIPLSKTSKRTVFVHGSPVGSYVDMLALLNRWNRLGAGQWQYWRQRKETEMGLDNYASLVPGEKLVPQAALREFESMDGITDGPYFRGRFFDICVRHGLGLIGEY